MIWQKLNYFFDYIENPIGIKFVDFVIANVEPSYDEWTTLYDKLELIPNRTFVFVVSPTNYKLGYHSLTYLELSPKSLKITKKHHEIRLDKSPNP